MGKICGRYYRFQPVPPGEAVGRKVLQGVAELLPRNSEFQMEPGADGYHIQIRRFNVLARLNPLVFQC